MMIRISSLMLFVGGIMLWIMCKAVPFLAFILMDWVAVFMMCGAMFILLFCFGISMTGKQYDTLPAGGALINFIRRDGNIIPLVGKRVFSGESFLEIPKLGLIEDLGKDTVFTWGRKRVRFGMENINYTPDPRFFNVTHELYKMGFDDNDDLFNVLDIPNMDPVKDKTKKVYYLERMGRIYWSMTHKELKGVSRLMDIFKRRPEKKIVFGWEKNKKKMKLRPALSEKKQEQKSDSIHPLMPSQKPRVDYDKIDRVLDRRR